MPRRWRERFSGECFLLCLRTDDRSHQHRSFLRHWEVLSGQALSLSASQVAQICWSLPVGFFLAAVVEREEGDAWSWYFDLGNERDAPPQCDFTLLGPLLVHHSS